MEHAVQRLMRDMHSYNNFAGNGQSMAQRADHHLVREFNRLFVLNCIREHGPIARVKIAQRTGLSRTAVSSIIDALLQEGFVREGELLNAAPMGGRRAIPVHFNADIGRIIGVDVGRSHLAMLITDLATGIIAQRSGPFDMDRGPAYCLPQLIREVQSFVEDTGVDWHQVVGIGLGIPGPLDTQLHKLSAPPGLPEWDGVDVWQTLQRAFNIPLYLDNDANLGALGESRYGAGRNSAYLAYIKIGTGIGAGLILNGRIYRGNGGSAGELGHVTIDENGPLCNCGNRGCLETLAGARAIVEEARRDISLADATETVNLKGSNSAFAELPVFPGNAPVDITDVIQAAQNGNAASLAALEHAGERIGVALAGLINLFNPSTIVIGGGVARAGELFFAPIRRAASSRSLPAAWKGTRILPAEMDTTGVALGAVSLVIDSAFGIPPVWTAQEEGVKAPGNVLTFYRSRMLSQGENTPA